MGGKHYQKLGKTELIKVPEKAIAFVQTLLRTIDRKEEPEKLMEAIALLLEATK